MSISSSSIPERASAGLALCGWLWCASCAAGGGAPADDVAFAPSASAVSSVTLSPPPVRSVQPSASASAGLQSPEARPGSDHTSVAACDDATDCGFDDPCVPRRCVAASLDQGGAACEETAPAPGACVCLAGGCTLKPAKPPAPDGPCETRGCVVDRAGGRCVANTGGVPENIRTNPGVNVGPSCDCGEPKKGCVFTWFDAVPCASDLDCWIDPVPRKHPIKRPTRIGRRPFKPCSDGEVAPVCKAGQCALGPAYSC